MNEKEKHAIYVFTKKRFDVGRDVTIEDFKDVPEIFETYEQMRKTHSLKEVREEMKRQIAIIQIEKKALQKFDKVWKKV